MLEIASIIFAGGNKIDVHVDEARQVYKDRGKWICLTQWKKGLLCSYILRY